MTQPRSSDPDSPPVDLYLASRSPRRFELLAQLGIRARVVAGETDEAPRPGEAPEAYVARIAGAKALAGWATLSTRAERPLLAADTAVVIDEQILGKPADAEDALQMLALLSGRSHSVLTAVTLLGAVTGQGPSPEPEPEAATGSAADSAAVSAACQGSSQVLVRTEVRMRRITPSEAAAYWATGEPRDKAGAYAIQGRGAVFVESIRGSYSNVVGLPLFETAALLREHGIDTLAG
jgi:septum formation protein